MLGLLIIQSVVVGYLWYYLLNRIEEVPIKEE